jgi:hypothetical protein
MPHRTRWVTHTRNFCLCLTNTQKRGKTVSGAQRTLTRVGECHRA